MSAAIYFCLSANSSQTSVVPVVVESSSLICCGYEFNIAIYLWSSSLLKRTMHLPLESKVNVSPSGYNFDFEYKLLFNLCY